MDRSADSPLCSLDPAILCYAANQEYYISTMTQYEIAKRLGVSEAAVSKWFKGKSLPSTKNLLALSKLLGHDMEALLKEFEKKNISNKYK